MPSRGQQLGKLLNPTGDIVETSLPPKIETFSQSVSETGKIEAAALGDDVSTIEQVSDINSLSASGNSIGDQRVVGNNLYIWNGTGWYRIALINETPTWDSNGQPAATYDLSSDSPQTATTITLAATDPDGFPINYSYVTGGSMDSIATISQDSSVFTITPKTEAQAPDGGTGTITFRASDGVNILPQVSSFSLTFSIEYSFEANLTASDGGYQDTFGCSVAISNDGNTIAVGARSWDGSYTNEGAAYVYTRSGTTWTEQTKLYPTQEVPNAGGSNPYFGSSVSISNDGNSLLVGMQNESNTMGNNTGAALFYTRSGSSWTRQQIIAPPSHIASAEQFGKSSHISGDGNTIVIGSPYRDDTYLNSGSVFIYNRSGNTFSLDTEIVGSQSNLYWSEDLCISDDGLTFIGRARGASKAFIVEKTGGSWPSSLTGTGVTDFSMSGGTGYLTDVTISGDGLTAAGGGLNLDTNGLTNNGKVSIYKKSSGTWSLEHSINGTQDSGFLGPISLSADGNRLLIGEYGKTVGTEVRAGHVYVYTRSGSTWSLDSVINDPDPKEYTAFGITVDISGDGNSLVIGAEEDDGTSSNTSYNSGSVFVFRA